MRAFRISVVAALGIVVAAAMTGCLPDAPVDASTANQSQPPPSANTGKSDDTAATPDLGTVAPPDLAEPPPDLKPLPKPDMASTDMAGLVNCFGSTFCDPRTSFCIKYHSGSTAAPGNLTSGPACYPPNDCNGNAMNCDCIRQDGNLGGACKTCVDHADGSYDCYAQ